MDKIKFKQSCEQIVNVDRAKNGIGTLAEKTLHAVLKLYFDENHEHHEIKVGSFVADIKAEHGIIEIQTRGFDKLRKKLESFLAISPVTVVYPIANTKWLIWIDENTGEVTKKRKSPKIGTPYEIFFELYKIKQYLENPNIKLCIVLLDILEYRKLDGWSNDKKKGSTRYERIPIDIIDEIYIDNIFDYIKLIPDNLPKQFTSKDYKKSTKLSIKDSQTALNVLTHVGAVKRVGKIGKQYLYENA